LKIHEELNDKLGVSMSYNNIGIVYYSMEKMDDAMTYFKKAIKMSEELDDKMGIADTYNNMGNIYLKKNLIDEAFACQLKSLKVAELNNDKKAIAIAYNSIGNIYEKKKNYQLAISNYTKSVDLSAEIDVKQGMMEGYKNLVSVYKQLKNSEEALYYLNLYYNLNDSLLNKENFKQLAVLSTQYETEKKENEILLLTKDKELNAKIIRQQKLVRWGLIGGFILLCISVFSIYRRYRYKQRANVILEKQKQVIEEKNILITDSINYAQTIQEAVLPTEEEVEKLFPEFFVLYKPKAIVSGDFYWVNKTNDKHICAVADCTGHGVPGAFMSLLGYNMLENIVKQAKDCNPGPILDLLNAELIARLSAMEGEETVKHGMDISIISMDVKSNKMEFAGAHNPVYIIRDNELIELKADKRGMGTAHTTPFSNREIEIKKGDMIYLFTDGFPDQIGGPKRKKFYYQPFKELLISISREQMNIQKQQLDEIHEQWLFGKYDQTDDILIMGIRY
ncbi:MAG TPA: tetratricopeptide repeat protein, partial [Bacteroidia bacterium]|nr:tetratricopeptide repeat protein [Bacteroidia bacterium]